MRCSRYPKTEVSVEKERCFHLNINLHPGSNTNLNQVRRNIMNTDGWIRFLAVAVLVVCKFSNAFVAFHAKKNVKNPHHFRYADAVVQLFSRSLDRGGENDKKKSKYVLGKEVDAEESGFYWNSFGAVNAFNISNSSGDSKHSRESKSSTNQNSSDRTFNLTGKYSLGLGKNDPIFYSVEKKGSKNLNLISKESKFLSRAFSFEGPGPDPGPDPVPHEGQSLLAGGQQYSHQEINLRYEDIDQSIGREVFDPSRNIDLVWSLLRKEAEFEAQREPLLVSFLYSTILNHQNLESALAFHLANRLTSPSMDSIQIMNIIQDALMHSPTFGRYMRADMIAVRNRDPACTCLPDVFLHFKGFHALQAYRVSNYLWKNGRRTIAHYLQAQISQHFQIDIHPNATLKSGIMLDHGTGLVIGETASVGHNCSILHGVTLGGSGKRGVDRHPKVNDGVLLGAGATLLGNINIGEGCQVGAGTLVIDDLPPHSVAVGVPSKIIGSYKEKKAQPSQTMNQVGSSESDKYIEPFTMDGI